MLGGVLAVFTGQPLIKPDKLPLTLFLHSVSVSVKDKYWRNRRKMEPGAGGGRGSKIGLESK